MAVKYILASLDGTGSKKWMQDSELDYGKNSHCYRFYKDFDTDSTKKAYCPGSGNAGTEVLAYRTLAYNWIIKSYLQIWKESPQHEIRVCLVGHSRGAAIAIDICYLLAKNTGVEVYFLGLYDAVDRGDTSHCDTITNARYVYHAIRAEPYWCGGTRAFMGNTGLGNKTDEEALAELNSLRTPSAGQSQKKYTAKFKANRGIVRSFKTSHGGIGGDPGFWNNGDDYCNIEYQLMDGLSVKGYGLDMRADNETLYYNLFKLKENQYLKEAIIQRLTGHDSKFLNRIRNCRCESTAADEFIRSAARLHDLPLTGFTEHVPYKSLPDNAVIQQMKKLIPDL